MEQLLELQEVQDQILRSRNKASKRQTHSFVPRHVHSPSSVGALCGIAKCCCGMLVAMIAIAAFIMGLYAIIHKDDGDSGLVPFLVDVGDEIVIQEQSTTTPPCVCTTAAIDPIGACEVLYPGKIVKWYNPTFFSEWVCHIDEAQWWEVQTREIRLNNHATTCASGDTYDINTDCGIEWSSEGSITFNERRGMFIPFDIAITSVVYTDADVPTAGASDTCDPGQYIELDVYSSSTHIPDTSYVFDTTLMSGISSSAAFSLLNGPGPGIGGSPVLISGDKWITFAINNNAGPGPGCININGDKISNWGVQIEYHRRYL